MDPYSSITGVLRKRGIFGHRDTTHTQGEHHVKIVTLHKTKNYQTLGARPGTDPFFMPSEGASFCPHLDLVCVASRTMRQ